MMVVVEWPGADGWILWALEFLYVCGECIVGLNDFFLYVWWHGRGMWVI